MVKGVFCNFFLEIKHHSGLRHHPPLFMSLLYIAHTLYHYVNHSHIISYFKVELVFVESDLRSKSSINVLKIVKLFAKVVVSAWCLVRFAVEIFHRKVYNELFYRIKDSN